MALPNDGAVKLNNPDFLKSPGRAVLEQFYDAQGNSIPNPDTSRAWATLAEFKPGKELIASLDEAARRFNAGFNANAQGAQASVNAGQDAVKAKVDAEVKATTQQLTQIIQIGERRIATNALPILGKLDDITAGVKSLEALNDAQIVALTTSIPWALAFITNERLTQTNSTLKTLTNAALATPALIVKGVSDGLSALGNGLISEMHSIIAKIESLILDPLAMLLTAILSAIKEIPLKAAEAVWDNLLAPAVDDGVKT